MSLLVEKLANVGIVVIGRNEGQRLQVSLESVIKEGREVVYVDSGSSDNSVEIAKTLGVSVIELDDKTPFTAARGRNAGFEYLLNIKPEIEFIQFVDGDCVVVEGWLESAVNELIARPDVVVVYGRCQEEFIQRSIYHRLYDIEWNTPVGEAETCGGNSMIRVTALKKVGGFNPRLIAGEEPELCVRLRRNGGIIMCINQKMVLHDANTTTFQQWWNRELRSGHAYAEGAWLHGRSPERHWVRESLRSWFWGLFLPLLALVGLLPTRGLSIILLSIAYSILVYRVYHMTLKRGHKSTDSILNALFSVIEKFPKLLGQIQFHTSRLLKKQRSIVEYESREQGIENKEQRAVRGAYQR